MAHSQSAKIARSALDPLWQTIREEVAADVQCEPVLASFLHATVLNHKSLEDALGFLLAGKLACSGLPAMLVRELIADAVEASPGIGQSMRADIRAIRDTYQMDAPTRPPPSGPPDTEPASGTGSIEAGPPPPVAGSPADTGSKRTKPVYKQWWFWVVVGVSALILIDIASDDSSNATTRDMGLGTQPPATGPVLLHF